MPSVTEYIGAGQSSRDNLIKCTEEEEYKKWRHGCHCGYRTDRLGDLHRHKCSREEQKEVGRILKTEEKTLGGKPSLDSVSGKELHRLLTNLRRDEFVPGIGPTQEPTLNRIFFSAK